MREGSWSSDYWDQLEVVGDDGSTLPIGGQRPRALLAGLLLEANRPVSVDQLIDAVWGESPPASGAGVLQVHVHALCKALGAERIVTRPPGYALAVHDGELDADRFAALVSQGEEARASSEPRRASELLHRALALWRGPVAYYESARELFDGIDDPLGRGILLANLTAAYEGLEDYERARSTALEALELQERIGDEGIIAITSFNLASLEVRTGDSDAAAAHLARSVTASLSLGYLEVTAYGLGLAAELAVAGGRHADAGVLAGSFLEVFREVGSRPQAVEAERHERVVAAVRAELDLEPLLAEGRTRSRESAVELALDVAASARSARSSLERG